jgi:hypothetical protein
VGCSFGEASRFCGSSRFCGCVRRDLLTVASRTGPSGAASPWLSTRDRAGWPVRTLLILGRSTRARAVAARPSSGADARLVRRCGRSRPVEGRCGRGLDVADREVGWQDLGIHGGR